MVNKTYAIEWLEKAYHDLDSANILFDSGHYTDTIGYLYHQSIEKTFKAILAYRNESIQKTHNLVEINENLENYIDLNEDDLFLLSIITTYYTKQRYPSQNKKLPSKDEIKKVKELSNYIFKEVLLKLEINLSELNI